MSLIKGKQLVDNTVTAAKVDTTNGGISTVNAGDALVEGAGTGLSRRDHQHAVATGGATAGVAIGDTAAEGASANLAREDHRHALPAPAAPANVTKSAAAAGASPTVARADHKHDVSTAAAQEITDSTNSEGTATSLARSDHGHAHGNRGGGALHAGATPSVAGFLSAADKTKLDSLTTAAQLVVKNAVQLASTSGDGNVTLSGEKSIDGVVTNNSRVLLKHQTAPSQNGIYDTAVGAWTRSSDMPAASEAGGVVVPVDQGTLNLDSLWFCTTDKPNDVVGTNDLTFALQAQGAPRMNGAGLQLNGNTLDVGANADGSITVNADDVQVGVLATDAQHGVRGGGTQHAVAVPGAPGTAGFLSGVDKAKLDGLTAGAQPNDTSRQEFVTTQVITASDTALIDQLDFAPASTQSLVLFLNGVQQKQGAGRDYTVAGQIITWLASSGTAVDMDATDELAAYYLS